MAKNLINVMGRVTDKLLQDSQYIILEDPRGYDYEQTKRNVAGSEPIGPIGSLVLFVLAGGCVVTCCVLICCAFIP